MDIGNVFAYLLLSRSQLRIIENQKVYNAQNWERCLLLIILGKEDVMSSKKKKELKIKQKYTLPTLKNPKLFLLSERKHLFWFLFSKNTYLDLQ